MIPPWFWRNLTGLVLIGSLLTSGYFFLNHTPQVPPASPPLTALDRAIPFHVWTVWPYLAMIVCEAVLPLTVRNRRVFQRLIVAYLVGMIGAFPCWLFFPTTYPRPDAPLDTSLSAQAYRLLTWIDTPHNCFPSGHLLFPALGCWAVWCDGRRWAPWVILAFVLCVPTILTTKQHYIWDLLGAAALVLAAITAANTLVPASGQCVNQPA